MKDFYDLALLSRLYPFEGIRLVWQGGGRDAVENVRPLYISQSWGGMENRLQGLALPFGLEKGP